MNLNLKKYFSISEYLKQNIDPKGKRKKLRMPLQIPVLYSCAKGKQDYREALSIDLSSMGIQIEVIDPSPPIKKVINKNGSHLKLKIDIPNKKYLDAIDGTIRWHTQTGLNNPERFRIGILFDKIGLDEKIELISYALRLALLRRLRIAGFALIGILILGSVIWVGKLYHENNRVQMKLNYSEGMRAGLEKEIADLSNDRKNIKKQLLTTDIRLRKKISSLTNMLSQRQREILEKNSEVTNVRALAKQKEAELQKIFEQKALADEQGEAEFKIPAILPADVVSLELKVQNDNLAKMARKEIKKRRYSNAALYYKKLVEKYPDSVQASKTLFQYLKKHGTKDEADEAFVDFSMKLLEEKKK